MNKQPTTEKEIKPVVRFEIRQMVKNVYQNELRCVMVLPDSERMAKMEYYSVTKANRGVYLELVKVTTTEECLAFQAENDE